MQTPVKSKLFPIALAVGLLCVFAVSDTLAQSRQRPRGSICGNPQAPCRTSATFQANDLPFRVPQNSVIFDTELFYAVILRTLTSTEDDCTVFVPESERLQTQALFPDRKVFASRCYDIENLFYTNVDPKYRIMAVYAGTTLTEAKRVLESVKSTGKFPGAYLRRMRTGFNGT
jgi:hypothetical protein